MSNSIGNINDMRNLLYDFNPRKIINRYDDNWELLFDVFKRELRPKSRMDINNPKNYWVVFSKAVLSCAHFLSRYNNLKEFDRFVSNFYYNEYSRLALPLLIEKEVYGFGFALACDFLKENGYPEFVKPDIHLKKIFLGIGISNSNSEYEIFKDIILFSKEIDKLPYSVDKLFWLVGSGYFYLNNIRINTDRDNFIERVKDKYYSDSEN